MFKERTQNLRSLFSFLLLISVMVFVMIVIGAITRLTDSGLSIVEWRLLWGFMPPLDTAEWNRIFALYQETEQYRTLNFGMSLEEFKQIFWWEYIHRFWGRLIGVVFVFGFVYLLGKKSLPFMIIFKLFVLFFLGACQAVLGWWMVNGSLEFHTFVEPYRLMLHLGLAFILWGYLISLLTATYNEMNWRYAEASSGGLLRLSSLLLLSVFVLVLSGALVAGLKAGLIYNDWPFMGGLFIPSDYFALGLGWNEFWENAITNAAAAQFHHRWYAVFVFFFVVIYRVYLPKFKVPNKVTNSASLLVVLLFLQACLGIATLMLHVPLWVAVAHQIGAAFVFAACVNHWRLLRPIG